MDKSPKIFQMAIIGIFVVLLIFGFLGFSGKLDFILPSSSKQVVYGNVTLWGTLPTQTMQSLIADTLAGDKAVTINYIQKKSETINKEFVEELARGKGPDMIMLSQDEILENADKLAVVSFQTFPEREFRNRFIEEGELFLRSDGIVAIPFSIDPIVMYWNRDIFKSALVASPPTLWKDFYPLVPKITIRDNSGNITRSLVSFGGYRNISNAKEIISLLMMQAGSPIVAYQNGVLSAGLRIQDSETAGNPVVSALRFFTEFSKQEKDSYSWNSSLPLSRTMFESGDLALYFGYASEYPSIKQKNPHLNFDVALVPQATNAKVKLTFGKMYGIATPTASKNPNGAIYAMLALSGKELLGNLGTRTGLPPVRRDLISIRPTEAVSSVFYDSALLSNAWRDPSPQGTNSLFMTMIETVTSERAPMNEALAIAERRMSELLAPYR